MLGEGVELKCKIVKKKSPTIEENKSKKEHINVVFIGHVGELRGTFRQLFISSVEHNPTLLFFFFVFE